jgi:hypothetical protein
LAFGCSTRLSCKGGIFVESHRSELRRFALSGLARL